MFDPVYIHAYNMLTPLGLDLATNWQSLLANQSGIARHQVGKIKDVFVAKISEEKFRKERQALLIPKGLSRLEQMLFIVGRPIISNLSITSRTAFILSTTKGNVSSLQEGITDEAYLYSSAKKIAEIFGFVTKPIVVCNACVSGLSAVAMAKRMIQMKQCDDVVILAADEVSEFVLSGFQAFQAVSDAPCRPFDANRNGVTLGEAAAMMYVSSQKSRLEIIGESSISDANHISGPSRTGEGLYRSIRGALKEAGIGAAEVDYISAHGTATLYNDEMEAIAFNRASLAQVPVNSLKGYYGHTLGASGLLELILSCESLVKDELISSKGFSHLGVSQPINIITQTANQQLSVVLKTASGFGGSNSAMLIKKI